MATAEQTQAEFSNEKKTENNPAINGSVAVGLIAAAATEQKTSEPEVVSTDMILKLAAERRKERIKAYSSWASNPSFLETYEPSIYALAKGYEYSTPPTNIPVTVYSAPYPSYEGNNFRGQYSHVNRPLGYWKRPTEVVSSSGPNNESAVNITEPASIVIEDSPHTEKFRTSDLKFLVLILESINKWIELDCVESVTTGNLESLSKEKVITQFHIDFYQRLKLVLPSKPTESLSFLEELNDDVAFKKAVVEIFKINSISKLARSLNYAVSELPTVNETDPALIIKLWYFLINQPKKKIRFGQKNDSTKKIDMAEDIKKRDLCQRWQRLVQLPPEKLVVLFLVALGIPFPMIDVFLDFEKEHASIITKEFFLDEAKISGITNDCRIVSVAALSYTLATVLTFNPFTNQIPKIASMEASLLKDATKKKLVEITQSFLFGWYVAASRKSPLNNKKSQSLIAHNSRVSLQVILEFLTKNYGVRTLPTNSNLVSFTDIIWLQRAIHNQPKTSPSRPN